ncbi:MAG: hypothetical protein ACKOCX_10190 [Planctomycetota bacterium]
MSNPTALDPASVPSVIVVDPRFDAYGPLAAAAREGRLNLHLRASGAEAMKLARRLRVDAWLVAEELDDMSGHDFVELLGNLAGGDRGGKVAMVGSSEHEPAARAALATTAAREVGAHAFLSQPIDLTDLANLLAAPAEERAATLAAATAAPGFLTVKVGIGAAMIAVAVLMMG